MEAQHRPVPIVRTGLHRPVLLLLLGVVGWVAPVAVEANPDESRIALTAEEQAWLEQNHTVRVREAPFPPYVILDGDEPRGISVDYLRLIAERTGIDFTFVKQTRPYADAIQAMANLHGPDLMPCLLEGPGKGVAFTNSYIVSPYVIVTQTQSAPVFRIEDLDGRSLATTPGIAAALNPEECCPDVDLQLFDHDVNALRAVSTGQADAYVGDLILATHDILRNGFSNLKVAAPSPLPDRAFSFGIRPDWPELRSIINKTLDSMSPGEHAAIRSRYLVVRYEHGVTRSEILKWILGAGGAAVLVVVLFVVWNVQLRRRVRERTEEVSRSARRFRATFEQAAVGVTHVSSDGRFLRINQRFCDMVGYTRDEMMAKTFQDITHPEDLEAVLENVQRLLRGEADSYSLEKRYLRKSGEILWVNLTVSLVREEAGGPSWFVSVVENITARKEAEQSAKDSRMRLELATAATRVASWDWDLLRDELYLSPEWKRQIGYEDDELPNRFEEWESRLHPDESESILKAVRGYLEGRRSAYAIEFRLRHKDGSYRWIYTRAEKQVDENGKPVRVFGCHVDITERRERELQVRESEERFRALIEQTPLAIEIHGVDGRFLTSNPAYGRLAGLHGAELQAVKESFDLRQDEQFHRLGFGPLLERLYAGETVEFPAHEYNVSDEASGLGITIPDSGLIWLRTIGFPLKDHAGRTEAVVLMSSDITAEKNAEDELIASRELSRQMLAQSPLSVQILSPAGYLEEVNQAWMEMWGVAEEDLDAIKATWCILEDEQVMELGLMPLVQRAFRGERVVLPDIEYDAGPALDDSGLPTEGSRKRWVRAHLYAVQNEKGEIVCVVDVEEDITDMKTAEKTLREYQQRLRALGLELTVSGERERRRIATELHDNAAQSLALARLRLAAAAKRVGDETASTTLDDASQLLKDSLQQIRELVLDLSSPALNEIGLAAAISEWMEEHLRSRHGLQTSFANECGDLGMEDDVLAVLFRNTRELLTNVVKHARATRVSVRFDCIDDALRITVADDGRGFAVSETERGPDDAGGFGLFSIRERMRDFGGALEIDSAPGKGCTARLSLPRESLR